MKVCRNNGLKISLNKYLLLLVFSFFFTAAMAQSEVACNDGVDNDGDGLVDCADGNCTFAANIERGCRCYDNIDNDGDGRIDQADSNCAPYFGLTFVGEGSNCSIVPPGANTPFDLVAPPIVSGQNTADTQSKVLVGDVDNDGIPDAIITSKWNNEVRVVATTNDQPDGSDMGDIKADYNLSGKKNLFTGKGCDDVDRLLLEHEIITADIDGDGKSEIFTIVSNREGNPSSPPTCFFLMGFEYDQSGPGGLKPLYDPIYLGTNRPGTFGIADMDGDGLAEIYLRDRIFAAETGALLASEGGKTMSNTADWDVNVTAAPVAVDIKSAGADGGKLELVVGPKIYQIPSLTNRNPASPASLSLWKDMNTLTFDVNQDGASDQYYVKLMNDPTEYGKDTHSSTSVADIDKDGYMDVVLTGALNSSVGNTTVFYWNVQDGTVSGYMTDTSADLGYSAGNEPLYTNYLNGWIWGTGRVNIGDANGDGKLDLSFVAGNQLYCVTTDAPGNNIIDLWANPRTINDSRSGVLTVTIYDFDNDGKPEMVYRDSQEVVIIDGSTGTNKYWSSVCQSHTYTEGPVIADMNGDGATDIGVTCNRSNSFDINDPIQQQALGEIRMYYSSGNEWLPTRQIWNQPGYHVTNINDDMTLPYPQLDGALVFSNGPCPNGTPGPQTPFNVFLNQIPFLSADGCPVFPAPDLAFVGDDPDNLPYPEGDPRNFPAVVVNPPICGNLDIQVSFNIINDGDLPISASIPVSFFHGDPTDPSITSDSLLYSTNLNVTNLQVGDTLTTAPVTFNGPGTVFRLYIVLNNNGTVLPINPNASVSNECRIDNNIYDVLVVPDPFTAVIEKIKDNNKCVAADPNVGELRARIYKGDPSIPANEVVDYSSYAFQWYYGTGTTNPVPAALGGNNYNLLALPEGDYTLVVTNTQKGCSTLPVDETINLNITLPAVTIDLLSHQTQCSPPNGALEAKVTGGNTGYSFEWFRNATTTGKTTAKVTGLEGDNYIVHVSRNGCTTTASKVVNDEAVDPTVTATATSVQNCSNPNSGSVTADAVVNGVVQDPANFTFNWFFHNAGVRGSALPGSYGTGKTRNGLPAGYYEVETINNSTQCKSLPFVIQVKDETVVPLVTITELAKQTSCDPANPNGRLQAIVSIGGVQQDPTNFTFEWFVGQNTLPANKHTTVSGVKGSIAEEVKGGGQSYTVKVTTALQCFDIADTVVSELLTYPDVTLTPSPNSICDPTLVASGKYNGGVVATITYGGNPVTDFTNYSLTWYNGSLASGAPRSETSASLSGLDDGDYTLVVERTDLGCEAAPETAHVNDATVLPVVTASPTGSTNCDPLLANGSAQVTKVDGLDPQAPYTFKWHTGMDLSAPIAGATADSLKNRQGSTTAYFTVLTTNTNTGCQQTSTLLIPDNRVLPVLSLTPSPNSICDPAKMSPVGSYSGGVVTTISNQIGAITNYSFAWSSGATTQNLANVIHGSYTLTTTHKPTGCISDPVTAQVTNDTVLPNIATTTKESKNCVAGKEDGQATVTGITPVGPSYKMLWHQGMDVSTPLAGESNALLDKRQGGLTAYYTVLVTNLNSGCQNTETVLIPDGREYPIVALKSVDNKKCEAPYSGSASMASLTYDGAAIASPYAGYSFKWSNGATTSSLTQQDEGSFTLEVTKDDVGCTSAPMPVEIEDKLFIPVIDIGDVNQTSCDTNNPNGQLTATIDETTNYGGATGINSGYTLTWTNNGAGPVLNLPGSPVTTTTLVNGQVNKLQGNLYYTITAKRDSTGCQNTETIFLPEILTYPVVVATSTNPVTRCDTPNGAVSSNVGGTETGYTFFWMNEVGATQTTDADVVMANANQALSNDGDYINLRPGNYTVVARDNFTSCVSQPVTQPVADNTLQSTVDILPALATPAVCGVNSGKLQADILGGVGPGFDVYWYRGGPVNSVDFYNNPKSSFPNDSLFQTELNNIAGFTIADNLYSALYSVLVIDKGNGCGDYDTRFLPFADPHIIDESITNSTLCLPSYNGGVSVDVQNPGGLPGSTATFSSYEFYFYEGSNIDPAKRISGPQTFGGPPVSYGPLEPGFYTIQVFENYSGNHCPIAKVIEIEQEAFDPIVNLAGSLTANSACNLNSADGAAEISIAKDANDVTVGTTYTLNVSPAPLSGSYPLAGLATGNQVINGLKPSNAVSEYTITVTSSTNCITERVISIPHQPSVAELVDGNVSSTAAEFCDALLETSAKVEVSGVSIIGGPADNIDDYRFDWYTDENLTTNILSAMGNATGTKGGEILSNVSAPLPSAKVTSGPYWVIVTKVNAGTTGGVGCFSAPYKEIVGDNTIKPVATLTPSANTACNTNYEGKIEVDMTTASGPGNGATYTYSWTRPAGITLPANGTGFNGINNVFSGVRDGFYTLTVTNQTTGCPTVATTDVVKLEVPVVITKLDADDNEYCAPNFNGNVEVEEVFLNGASAALNLFTFDLYANSPTSAPVQSGATYSMGNLEKGTFYVVATVGAASTIGSGCKSPPARADVKDIHVNPTIGFTTIANTACDNNFDGQINITSSTPSGPGVGANYDFTWRPTGNVIATNVASPYNISGLADGQYIIRAANRTTACFVDGTVTLQKTPPPLEILTINKSDQMICNPDGSIEVLTMNPATVAAYNFRWYKDTATTPPLVDGSNALITAATLNTTNYQTIGAGTYYVVGTKNAGNAPGSGCSTPPFRVDIDDLSVDPKLAFTFEPNSSCDEMDPNGVVLATASERDNTTDNYTFSWTKDGGALPGVTTQDNTSPTSELNKAFEGYYVLTVTNTVTGCPYSEGLNLKLDRTISLPNIVEVDVLNPTNCFPTGSAEVVEITIGGTTTITDPAQLDAGFDYEWHKNIYPGGTINGQLLANLPNQLPGRYFVLVQDLLTDCKSLPIEVMIDSADIIYPVVNIQQTLPQITCDDNMPGTAVLVSTADGQNDTNPDYTFTWYPSLDLTGTSFANTSTINNLQSGNYSVEVFNAATNCTASQLYIVPDNAPQFMPQLSLSTSPRTSCDVLDGVLLATGLPFPIDSNPVNNYPFPYDYTAVLQLTPPVTMSNDPNFPLLTSNFLQTGLAEGTYTVQLTDNNTGCVTTGIVAVDDRRVYPQILIVQDNPLINCDPARPNGQLSATADNGQVGGYSFDWYAGATVTGTSLSNNNKLIGHTKGMYTVEVANDVTGCSNTSTGEITDGTILPPVPLAELIRARTNCLTPNGWVAASVDGKTLNYTFNWYDGSSVKASPDFTGVNYIDRDVSPYAVTATDVITGCISLPAIINVPDSTVTPEVNLISTPSYCLRPTGTVTLELLTKNVVLTDITWYDDGLNTEVGIGPATYDLPAGYYRAEFITSEGCDNQAVVEVGTEILSYNLVSVNGDNSNDVWIIDCIENFPSNNVKVFNRSGVKVYEANGYNNTDVIFRGIGEKGLYALGNDLPDGTYFYIIDKRDGSKPINGYLELVR